MPFRIATQDREWDKFKECPTGETAVRTCISNDSTEPVPVTGSISATAPTGPLKRTVVTVTDVAADPLTAAQTGRISIIIRNKSQVETIFFGEDNSITADDTSTGGWEIGPGEDFALDISDANNFFLKAAAGKTAIVKLLENKTTGVSGGGGGFTGSQVIETPTGTINGVNTIFAVSQTPISSQFFSLYLDGVFQRLGTHFTRSGLAITMTTAPNFGQTLDAVYWV